MMISRGRRGRGRRGRWWRQNMSHLKHLSHWTLRTWTASSALKVVMVVVVVELEVTRTTCPTLLRKLHRLTTKAAAATATIIIIEKRPLKPAPPRRCPPTASTSVDGGTSLTAWMWSTRPAPIRPSPTSVPMMSTVSRFRPAVPLLQKLMEVVVVIRPLQ